MGIEDLILKNVLSSPELHQLIDQRAEMKMREREFPPCLTRDQLAKLWQVSKPTLDRMTDEELKLYGYRRRKIGVSVRFEKLK